MYIYNLFYFITAHFWLKCILQKLARDCIIITINYIKIHGAITMSKEIKKIVLAYSGGLDTSIIIPWLKENYPGCEVIAVSGNVGQADELDGLEEKAIATGASKLYIEDLREEFITDYIYPSMKAGAKYENTYLLGTAFARPIIAKGLLKSQKLRERTL